MKPIIDLNQIPQDARFIDARFRHGDKDAARNLFLKEHIPGATFVDMESELSGLKDGSNGRHPIPEVSDLEILFSKLGIDKSTHVIAYDDADHAGAARLWMLLQWMGHEKVQVLNGGLKAWKEAGKILETGPSQSYKSKIFLQSRPLLNILTKDQISDSLLVDARAPERYRGEIEHLDPYAGHIPGAKNLFYKTLLSEEGRFLPDSKLNELFIFQDPVFYCGSGVTAAVLLIAATQVGKEASIYAGSWSEWCQIPDAKIERNIKLDPMEK